MIIRNITLFCLLLLFRQGRAESPFAEPIVCPSNPTNDFAPLEIEGTGVNHSVRNPRELFAGTHKVPMAPGTRIMAPPFNDSSAGFPAPFSLESTSTAVQLIQSCPPSIEVGTTAELIALSEKNDLVRTGQGNETKGAMALRAADVTMRLSLGKVDNTEILKILSNTDVPAHDAPALLKANWPSATFSLEGRKRD